MRVSSSHRFAYDHPVCRVTALTTIAACCLTLGCIPCLSTSSKRMGTWDPRCATRSHRHTAAGATPCSAAARLSRIVKEWRESVKYIPRIDRARLMRRCGSILTVDMAALRQVKEKNNAASGKYWGVAAIPKGIAAMPPIAAMLLQRCNCGCVAAVLLQYLVAAILPQWGHCCNTLCALQQSTMPQGIATTLRQ